MGVREILAGFMSEADPAVREIITKVLFAEQQKIDVEHPQLKKDVIDIIDAVARGEART